jgi:hypothetical protein
MALATRMASLEATAFGFEPTLSNLAEWLANVTFANVCIRGYTQGLVATSTGARSVLDDTPDYWAISSIDGFFLPPATFLAQRVTAAEVAVEPRRVDYERWECPGVVPRSAETGWRRT